MYVFGPSMIDVHTLGGGLCQKWTNVNISEGIFKLQWTSSNCAFILTFVTVYSCLRLSFHEMAQKWAKVTLALQYYELGATRKF